MTPTIISVAIVALLAGFAAGYWRREQLAKKNIGTAEQKAKHLLEEAEAKSKEVVLEAKERAATITAEAEKEDRERKSQINALENRLIKREEAMDKKIAALDSQETTLRNKLDGLKARETEVENLEQRASRHLEELSGLSAGQAREILLAQYQERYQEDLAAALQKMTRERHEELENKANEIITTALQRYARSHVSEMTTSIFPLGDEDLKGKIIGREGRNIRALERLTGVELLIDETPDAIVISSFDPFRRELARMALVNLIRNGRIQPAKIEEKVEEAKSELNKRIGEIGEAAVQEVGIYDLPKEIVQLLGRLHFRTSFGQNVLTHSLEMTFLAGMMAADLGLNTAIAKKGALLHDIGKAIDHEVEGTHVDLGRKILKKYGIDESVIEAMQSHHEDYPYARPEAYVVTAADVLSAARPGARRGTLENYLKRLGDLEKIALEFPGVKQAYAISAGRELRIFVTPEKIDDFRALEMAREVADRVQSELKFPGEIKVTVIREMRAVEYAR